MVTIRMGRTGEVMDGQVNGDRYFASFCFHCLSLSLSLAHTNSQNCKLNRVLQRAQVSEE